MREINLGADERHEKGALFHGAKANSATLWPKDFQVRATVVMVEDCPVLDSSAAILIVQSLLCRSRWVS